MQSINKDKSLQSFILNATTASNGIALIFALIASLVAFKLPGGAWYLFLMTPLAFIGIVYTLFAFNYVQKRVAYLATYIAILIVLLQFFIVVAFTGALSSPYFAAWVLVLSITCALSLRAFYINAIAALVGYVALAAMTFPHTHDPHIYLTTLGITGLAILLGAFLAIGFDQLKTAAHTADRITDQLDSTKLSEKLMLASIADAVIGVDDQRKIILFNSTAEDLTGWDASSANGVFYNTVLKLKDVNGNDVTKANDPFTQVFEQKKQITSDLFHFVDKQSNKISLSISIAPTIGIDNKVSGAIAVLHDISEQKALQRERNEFVSTASHEMRTPVAAIEGYISMATNPNLATVDDRARNYLDKAHQSALHLGKLFQDLLSVTKIEDQRLNDSRQVFNLSDLVQQIANEMEIVAQKKNLRLFTHLGGGGNKNETVIAPVLNVKADPERIREVITNLVDNAIKYTSTGSVTVELKADRNYVTVRVQDTGMGISAEDQKHMFEKFYRVNNTMTREIGGTGLGLYIARNLVELYGGRIWVESKPGAGSSFMFTLPLVKS